MDRYLPVRLQEAAAAANIPKEPAAVHAIKHPEMPTAPQTEPYHYRAAPQEGANALQNRAKAPQDRPNARAKAPEAVSPARAHASAPTPAPVNQPYITPMPVAKKPESVVLQPELNSAQAALKGAKGLERPIESTNDIGCVQQAMEFLNIDGVDRDADDDLEAPSSFCCPITTVSLLSEAVALSAVCAVALLQCALLCACSCHLQGVIHRVAIYCAAVGCFLFSK